jgi:hypothetical protein
MEVVRESYRWTASGRQLVCDLKRTLSATLLALQDFLKNHSDQFADRAFFCHMQDIDGTLRELQSLNAALADLENSFNDLGIIVSCDTSTPTEGSVMEVH